ncbi:hypothetical protein Leryth_002187 [Lithospermum erythrorhizon]|nr:hypothetical protein Leryth_002187 [Lithospermum erythrorhizon]
MLSTLVVSYTGNPLEEKSKSKFGSSKRSELESLSPSSSSTLLNFLNSFFSSDIYCPEQLEQLVLLSVNLVCLQGYKDVDLETTR